MVENTSTDLMEMPGWREYNGRKRTLLITKTMTIFVNRKRCKQHQ